MNKNSLLFALLLIAQALYAWAFVDFGLPPIEDAAMLMRYVRNLAAGEGWVWNVGESPVDGSTDMLLTALAAVLVKLGVSLETSIRLLISLGHIASMWLIWESNRKYSLRLAFVFCLYFALNPGVYFIATYFGTTFFAFWIALLAYIAKEIYVSEAEQTLKKWGIYFAVVAVLCGMARPEGVLFAGYLLLALVWVKRGNGLLKKWLLPLLTVALLLGLGYFLLRWWYFEYPFPNPFYRKGGGKLFPQSAFFSVYLTLMFILPTLPCWLWALWNKKYHQALLFTALPVGLFAFSFLFLSNEMNFCGRFQYPMLAVVLMSPFWGEQVLDLQKLKKPVQVIVSLWLMIALAFPIFRYRQRGSYEQDGKYEVAVFLSKFKASNYTLATTEAGILPCYSQWRALDVWGLNDKWIAHKQVVSTEYLDRYKPEVLMIHTAILPEQEQIYRQMLDTLHHYVQTRPYTLARSVRDPRLSPEDGTHLYYVRKDCPAADSLVKGLAKIGYKDWEEE